MGEVILKRKTFSIVTVVFNARDLIEKTMNTIFSQTFNDYEYIVIDGNSTDGTMSVIQKFRDKIDIVISEPDNGIYDAMNKAISMASGKYINFMNCGDYFVDSNVLQVVSEKISSNPDVAYGNTIINTIVGKYLIRPEKVEDTIMKQMPFCHQSTFVKADVARQHPFDLSYKVTADYNMFMQLYKEGKTFLYIDYPIAIYQNDSEVVDHKSYKRVLEAARVNKMFKTRAKAYIRLVGGYLRSVLPDSIYRMYRKYKYYRNPRYEFIGN